MTLPRGQSESAGTRWLRVARGPAMVEAPAPDPLFLKEIRRRIFKEL